MPSTDGRGPACLNFAMRTSCSHACRQSCAIGIRIGFNFGPVVEKDGDVFGDAVNLAARLAGQAQKDQIITSRETVEAMSPVLKTSCRRLYSIQVKGKASIPTIA